ncbi:hypothetical protein [Kytococcus sedentarius]|uniref:hypothetical protein n=1 Tax=Kytococcus sedentarius TaxID=1276 RepID=UPI0035BC73F7
MFKTRTDAALPRRASVGAELRAFGRWVARGAAVVLVLGTVVGLIGRGHRRPVPLPAELGGGTEWIEPAWATLPMGLATWSVPVLLWGLCAQWVGRVLHDQAQHTAAPRGVPWVTGLALTTVLAAVLELAVSIVAVLSWSWDGTVDELWNPFLAQAAFILWAPLTGGLALLVVVAAGITWGLVTPAGPSPRRPRAHLS